MKDCIMRVKGECVALDVERCPERCRFYKNAHDQAASIGRAHRRIASRPIAIQQDISIKYYDGYMPWLRKQEGR